MTIPAQRSALVLSPFSTWPPTAGHRLRVQQSSAFFAKLGLDIHLLLYLFEDNWRWRFDQTAAKHICADWPNATILLASSNVGQPPQSGRYHALDEWWDPLLETYLARLFLTRHFDLLIVHNVWLSKALDLAPPATVKVLDTHDLFHTRDSLYTSMEILPDFFLPTKPAELFGLSRADLVLTIKEEDEKYLESLDIRSVITLPYVFPEPRLADLSRRVSEEGTAEYKCSGSVVFGIVASGHPFNVHGINLLVKHLRRRVSSSLAPVELRIAGTVCDHVNSEPNEVVQLRGTVDDEATFLNEVDFVVAPAFLGTGFKVKVAQGRALGKPMLVAEHSAESAYLDEKLIVKDPDPWRSSCARLHSSARLSKSI
jgi:hypothetical protein